MVYLDINSVGTWLLEFKVFTLLGNKTSNVSYARIILMGYLKFITAGSVQCLRRLPTITDGLTVINY